MAKLEDRRKPGLPPPPAPTRRGANPWQFSSTARKREAPPPHVEPGPLERLASELGSGAGTETQNEPPLPADEAPPHEAIQRSGFGLLPLIILGMAVVIVLRTLMKARGTGDWTGIFLPLLLIFFVAHGWWKLRRRRSASKATRTD